MSKDTRSRGWVFTLNNYTKEDEEYIQNTLSASYIIYGREESETGTPHLQGYLYFKNARKFSTVRKLRKWNIEAAKGDVLQNQEYVKKDDDWFEKGTRPLTDEEKGDRNKDRYKRAYELAMEGNVSNIDSDILIRHYGTLKKLRSELTKVKDLDYMPLCMFIYGPTGTGKSRITQELIGENCYRKQAMTKWFTGYNHEKSIWIDEIEAGLDFDSQSMYKTLCDRYACPVESKGGNMTIRPEVIIFTSNYEPCQVFRTATEAMLRRLRVYKFTHSIEQNENAISNIRQDYWSFQESISPLEGPEGPQEDVV